MLAYSGVQHVVCLFCFSLSCVPCVVSFSRWSLFWLPIRYYIRLFRCGIAPIKTETRPHETLNTDNSILIILMKFNIRNVILLTCPVYSDIRDIFWWYSFIELFEYLGQKRRNILISVYKWKYYVLYLQFLRCYGVEIKMLYNRDNWHRTCIHFIRNMWQYQRAL